LNDGVAFWIRPAPVAGKAESAEAQLTVRPMIATNMLVPNNL
jgi:hypothetical protein